VKRTEPERGAFKTTRWSMVNAAGETSTSDAREALAELCRVYWPPLYTYLRRRGFDPDDAQDLTQGFFTRLLERRDIRSADPTRGRFRSFLLTALKRYVINEHARAVTDKRGGGRAALTLDFAEAELACSADFRGDDAPDRVFDRKWAGITIDMALRRLRAEYDDTGRQALAGALLPYISEAGALAPYKTVAEQLGMTEGAVRVAVHRLRQRFGMILRDEVAQTVLDPALVDDEVRELIRAVSS